MTNSAESSNHFAVGKEKLSKNNMTSIKNQKSSRSINNIKWLLREQTVGGCLNICFLDINFVWKYFNKDEKEARLLGYRKKNCQKIQSPNILIKNLFKFPLTNSFLWFRLHRKIVDFKIYRKVISIRVT